MRKAALILATAATLAVTAVAVSTPINVQKLQKALHAQA